jgi:hypothetical protein
MLSAGPEFGDEQGSQRARETCFAVTAVVCAEGAAALQIVPRRRSQTLPKGSRGFLFRTRRKSAAGALRRARADDGAHAAEGRSDTAGGTVGVDIHQQSHGWGSHVIEFVAIGTAIIPDEDAEDHVIPDPTTVLDLD